ncbi:hypothetical protein [Capnocytophaga stomatis]|uniref:DUF4919 domain-containing protein n=1 Tax=Capnocytophaga stomatis TaxID=1848904 RepID=A0A250FZ74_9FLAO|nr:hypothetical protein [Capnocytophaga stomatis]ATA90301.1 hypothetical protein CGC58_11515 [Capnocytophaga stomatis]GIJ94239.1 hypothetical protein CAPN002_14570 [Capnocytophaga stomatis]GIJ97894.1 hypothetical protein CAPN001_24630 [Capnocytophaga stomatis]GIM50959.1 hypothetical protein CAPN003_24110 [Capnocytophaga stomatis]
MKQLFFLVALFFSVNIFAQEKVITFVFEKKHYDSIAKLYVNKMIEANKLLKERDESFYQNLYIGGIDSLEILVQPIFEFRKDILDYKDSDNLISYIDFVNNPEKQAFTIYNKGEFMYTFFPNNEWKQALRKNDLSFFEDKLKKNPFESTKFDVSLNIIYALKDNFSFIFKNTECVVINGNVFAFAEKYNISTIGKFNSVFIEDLYLFQKEFIDLQEGKKTKSYSFSEYKPKYPLKKVKLNIIF